MFELLKEKYKSAGWPRVMLLALYYAVVLAAVVYLQARGSLTTPTFVYQGF